MPHGIECCLRLAAAYTNAGHDAETLWFDVDLSLLTVPAADRFPECVVSSAKPRAVPAVLQNRPLHALDRGEHSFHLCHRSDTLKKLCVFRGVFDKHARDKNTFSNRPFGGAAGLEALARFLGKAVEVQTIVPVCPADQRKSMWAEMGHGEADAAAQMLQQGHFAARLVVERSRMVKDGEVTRFLQIGDHRGDQPKRIVVEAPADIGVATLGQRLILVIR